MEESKYGRQTISQRAIRRVISGVMAITLAIAILVIANTPASAQVECLGVCEAQLAACIRNQGNGSSLTSASCAETYEACVDACLGQYAGILD